MLDDEIYLGTRGSAMKVDLGLGCDALREHVQVREQQVFQERTARGERPSIGDVLGPETASEMRRKPGIAKVELGTLY